jgi:hypothetical protein
MSRGKTPPSGNSSEKSGMSFVSVNPLTLAVGVLLAVILLGPICELLGFTPPPEPWYSRGECVVCGGWENVIGRHGGVFQHIMRPMSGLIFLWGIFILFRDLDA